MKQRDKSLSREEVNRLRGIRDGLVLRADEICDLAAQGFDISDIAAKLESTEERLRYRIKHTAVVREAYERGVALATAKVAGALFEKAMAGDTSAMKLWLSTAAGWGRKDRRLV